MGTGARGRWTIVVSVVGSLKLSLPLARRRAKLSPKLLLLAGWVLGTELGPIPMDCDQRTAPYRTLMIQTTPKLENGVPDCVAPVSPPHTSPVHCELPLNP